MSRIGRYMSRGALVVLLLSSVLAVAQEKAAAISDPKAMKKWLGEITRSFGYMEKEPLDVWPEPEPCLPIGPGERAKGSWRMLAQDGTLEYSERPPRGRGNYAKVWCVFGSPVHVMERTTGGGVVDATPADVWGRMWWHTETHDWGASHPNHLGFKHDQDRAAQLLETVARGLDPQAATEARRLWYSLLNARAGAPRPEDTIQARIQKDRAALHALLAKISAPAGIGDLLWQIQEITIDVEPRINTTATIQERVEKARTRRALFRQVIDELKKAQK